MRARSPASARVEEWGEDVAAPRAASVRRGDLIRASVQRHTVLIHEACWPMVEGFGAARTLSCAIPYCRLAGSSVDTDVVAGLTIGRPARFADVQNDATRFRTISTTQRIAEHAFSALSLVSLDLRASSRLRAPERHLRDQFRISHQYRTGRPSSCAGLDPALGSAGRPDLAVALRNVTPGPQSLKEAALFQRHQNGSPKGRILDRPPT
jgi:hypothetical protein